LIISFLLPWIFAISNEKHSALGVKVAPFNSGNFVLPHGGCDGKSDDTPDRNLLPDVSFKGRNDSIEFVLRWTAIALIAPSDEPEACKGDPGEINWFCRNNNSVHSGGMRENRLDISKIDADGHGASTLQRTRLSKLDDALSIKVGNTKMSEPFIKEGEARGLGPTYGPSNLFQVLPMKRDDSAKQLGIPGFPRRRGFLAVDPSFNIKRPFLRVLSPEKCLVDIFPLSSDLDSPGA